MALEDTPVERRRGEAVLSTDRARLDVDAIHAMLRVAYWAVGMDRATLERAIANSLCVAVYEADRLVAFARAVTDLATYAYLTDVIVHDDFRGRGYGRWMVEMFLEHPDLQGLRRMALFTRDAQGLYEPFGFTTGLSGGSSYMEIRFPSRSKPDSR